MLFRPFRASANFICFRITGFYPVLVCVAPSGLIKIEMYLSPEGAKSIAKGASPWYTWQSLSRHRQFTSGQLILWRVMDDSRRDFGLDWHIVNRRATSQFRCMQEMSLCALCALYPSLLKVRPDTSGNAEGSVVLCGLDF
jgi:hypothetical protein